MNRKLQITLRLGNFRKTYGIDFHWDGVIGKKSGGQGEVAVTLWLVQQSGLILAVVGW